MLNVLTAFLKASRPNDCPSQEGYRFLRAFVQAATDKKPGDEEEQKDSSKKRKGKKKVQHLLRVV